MESSRKSELLRITQRLPKKSWLGKYLVRIPEGNQCSKTFADDSWKKSKPGNISKRFLKEIEAGEIGKTKQIKDGKDS